MRGENRGGSQESRPEGRGTGNIKSCKQDKLYLMTKQLLWTVKEEERWNQEDSITPG